MKNDVLLTITVLIFFITCTCTSNSPQTRYMEQNNLYDSLSIKEVTAYHIIRNITVGWNLGNTLDTAELDWINSNSISDYERAWGNPVTTKRNIDTIKNAGFNTIRIPVSWSKCIDSEYNIRQDWMKRVKEVTDYAVSNKMIIIINTHHDESIFKYIDSGMEESKKALKKIWEQIAEYFKDYGAYLLFEALNEPRTKELSTEWTGGTASEHLNLNIMNQLFVDTVRSTGGNNAYRTLIIPTYGASPSQFAMSGLKMPNDTIEKRIIVSIHVYEPYHFVSHDQAEKNWSRANVNNKSAVTAPIDRAYNTFVSKGIPVIIGEFSAADKNNETIRADWAEFNVSYAKSKGIPCIWWDDGGHLKLLDRQNNKIIFPEIVNRIMQSLSVN